MKFTVPVPEFQKILQSALQAVPPRSTLPVLEHFLVCLNGSTLTITSTDQELTIIATIAVDGAKNGEILIPARKCADIVKALGNAGEITLSSQTPSHIITLQTDFGEYVLHGLATTEFPPIPDFSAGVQIHIPHKEAIRIAKIASFAASRDEYRPAMTGMLLECKASFLNAVTTDGYRLVKVTVPAENTAALSSGNKVEVILPIRAVELLKRAEGDVTLLVSDTHAKFMTHNATVITRIIDERFPQYEAVIPKDNDKFVRIGTNDVSASVKRVALFSNTNTKQIRFVLTPNTLAIVAEDQETGNRAQEQLRCDYAGDRFEIGFNYRYIEEAIAHLAEDGANATVMSFSAPNRAALIKPLRENEERDDVVMLVMPVRL
ncbi:MAG: DNA polymerase III subunit beta [Bacteroidota bacterium]|nr:DNA polymerase III subunit beta [Candidatus Kapabacteria bacterium]MDW8219962.1 DNA polymerase III subunit beta [Bacteroidota bacterium]